MKLKTKITLICCTSVFLTALICSVTVLILARKSFVGEAQSRASQEAMSSISNIQKEIGMLAESAIEDDVMEYIIKKQRDDYLLCFTSAGKEVFNNTVLGKEDFDALTYSGIPGRQKEYGAALSWEHRHFMVYHSMEFIGYNIYKLEDITYAWTKMRYLEIGLFALTAGVMVLASVILLVILNKMFDPLQELNAVAGQIACGRYDQRIETGRKDEIGELSESFNKMAEAVQERTHNLEESERRKTLFMGNLTHELKTPLTAISGYAQTLLSVKLPEEDKEEALSYIYEESCRLERLSKKMMNLLLLDEEQHIDLKEISAKELFHAARTSCSKILQDRKVTVECRENGETFFVDSDLMTDVLVNLIDNAVKAGEEGSQIILSASGQTIEVQDFGKGIPQEEQDRILEPFYMIDKSRSGKNGGAGLGLAITAMILKKHNCRLLIESEPGKGTRILILFCVEN